MKARIIKDGDRVIVTFTEIDNPEDFLEKVAKVICGYTEEKITPEEVKGLVPVTEEKEESCVAPEDFEAPYAGKTPQEIIAIPKFEGFYFLCRTKIPEKYQEETRQLLHDLAVKKELFTPPYKNVDRMKRYLLMSEKILGPSIAASEIVNAVNNGPMDEDKKKALVTSCKTACEMLKIFFTT